MSTPYLKSIPREHFTDIIERHIKWYKGENVDCPTTREISNALKYLLENLDK